MPPVTYTQQRAEVTFARSSNVQRAVLDVDSSTVEVTFANGMRYRYGKFTNADLDSWAKAQSSGRWHHQHVKSKPHLHPLVPRDAWAWDDRAPWEPRIGTVVEEVVPEPVVVPEPAPPAFLELIPGLRLVAQAPIASPVPTLVTVVAPRPAPVSEGPRRPPLLTHEELRALPSGTTVEVLWSGGAGPYLYSLHHDPERTYALTTGDEIDQPQHWAHRVLTAGNHRAQDWVRIPAAASWPSPCRRCGVATYGGCCPTDPRSGPVASSSTATASTDWSAVDVADRATIAQAARASGNMFATVTARSPDPVPVEGPGPAIARWNDRDLRDMTDQELEVVAAQMHDDLANGRGVFVPDYGDADPQAYALAAMEQAVQQEFTDPMEALARGDVSQLAELLRQADAEAARRDFGTFYRVFWRELDSSGREFQENPGTEALIAHAQALGEGRISKLGIACSPGFGKSTAFSIGFPAWMWARDPSWRVICASHAFELARDIAGKFLRLVTSDKYKSLYPEVELASDALRSITTTAGGIRYAVGVGGALTGLRAHAGIIDDSLNAIDASRADAVRAVNNWYDQAWSTRFDDHPGRPAMVVGIQQRLAENDLIAHMRGHGVEILELAARFDPARRCKTSVWEDPRTEEGEILAPTIHSAAFLEEKLRVLRPHGFAGQYQQAPAPREGNQFKIGMWGWFQIEGDGTPRGRPKGARTGPAYVLNRRPDGSLDVDWVCVSCDPTGGSVEDDASGFGLSLIMGKAQRRFVIRDLTPGPRSFNQQLSDLQNAVLLMGQLAGKQSRFKVLVEKKALGVGAMAKIEEALGNGELRYPSGEPIVAEVKPYEPSGKGDKNQRADHIEPDVAAGLIHLLDGGDWDGWLQEFGLFPRGSRDDRVDTLSQCVDDHRVVVDDSQWSKALAALGIR